jgi:hypothetical protein
VGVQKELRPDGTIDKYKARLVAKVIPKSKAKILIHLLLD